MSHDVQLRVLYIAGLVSIIATAAIAWVHRYCVGVLSNRFKLKNKESK